MNIVQNLNKFSTAAKRASLEPRLYVPAPLADNKLLTRAGIKPLLQDKYKFFLHTLYLRRVMNRNLTRKEPVEINAERFEQYVGKKLAAPIVKFWVEQGVVETNGSYQATVRSKAYRFTRAYQDAAIVDVGFLEDKFEKKVRLMKQKEDAGVLDMTKIQNVFLHFNLHELKVDVVEAQLAINQRLFDAGLANDEDAKDKANLDTLAIHAINEGDYRAHRDHKGHRLHTNFTNCSKYLRKHFFIDTGEALVNLDVSNSQPLFLCILLVQHVKGITMPQDMLDYISACEKGQLYETMMVAMGLEPNNKPTRDKMKRKLFLAVFYGKNEAAHAHEEWHVFSRLYPSVAAFITRAKQSDYKSLSHRMQQAEAALVLDTVVKTIAETHPAADFFATTIHDSIVTTATNAAYVMTLMTHAFAALSLRVTINCEDFK